MWDIVIVSGHVVSLSVSEFSCTFLGFDDIFFPIISIAFLLYKLTRNLPLSVDLTASIEGLAPVDMWAGLT